ncbi:hypothetical protein RAB80_012644 [Fusarium oxysporum f. sp. vasinfectum]|uniref:Uncharacterized protein n=1 Tax=Fusarium oxysporum f. sp. vasinfectum 25433 TaxID=1089449 RepID=X0LJU6_FUSOX|nr:hypothetical protein FOTG_07261 [Fusarium oxysporum f. sp. vasinfectum 25433]KAK2672565.1 hypothetical protein RAB80_012644 [Fusarium oxysporum f. sp. vasinfectum]KAK2928170.1 hypothetical protein FoTM2_011032 [Fusarium oxysporum f. sp. vasinfectum]
MDAQQETSRVLNLKELDLILSFIPNPDGAKLLRDQFVSACRIVEAKADEVEAIHGRAESQSKLLQAQFEELNAEREAFREQKDQEIEKLKAEQVKLENLAHVGRLAEQLQSLQVQATGLGQENQTLKNQNENLSTERDRANFFAEQARSQLEENEEILGQKDSKIEEIQIARDDLLKRLTEASLQISQGEEARRRLDEVQHVLQTAETERQELAKVKSKLQRTEQAEMETQQRMADLQRTLEREKKHHDACSAELTKTISDKRDTIHQKSKLEDECSSVRNELYQLRSQGAMDLERQMKDQWATVKEVLEKQLSDKRSHEETVRQLKDSWSSEKQALEDRISAQVSFIENQEQQLQTLQSRVSTLEPLQNELDTVNENTNRVQALLEQASSNLLLSEQRVAQFEEMASVSEKELADLKAENGRLQESAESVSQQLRTSNGTIERLLQECDTVNEALSSLQAQSVRIPEGTAGELSTVCYKAANELRDIPIVVDRNGELDAPQLAAELITLIGTYRWKEILLNFLHSRPDGWFYLQQVMDENRDGMAIDGKCQYHDDCIIVKVIISDGSPTLKFIFSE